MKSVIRIAALAAAHGVLTVGATAWASVPVGDEAARAACVDRHDGASCVRDDGSHGVCELDRIANVLTCDVDDDASSGASSDDAGGGTGDVDVSDGCSAAPRSRTSLSAPAAGFLGVAWMAAARRSRRLVQRG